MTTFEPSFDLIQEDDCNTLLLYLPEELRVQLTRSRVLKISGTRVIGDNKWSSFQKDFPIPENCDTSRISAKFEEGILYVRQPKVIVPEHKTDGKINPPSPPPKPAEQPPTPKIDPPPKPAEQPPAPKIDPPSKPAEQPPAPKIDPPQKITPNLDDTPKTAPNHLDDSKQQESVKDFLEKKKEEKQSKKDEKVTGRKNDENDDRKDITGKNEKVSPGVGRVGGYSVVNAAEILKMEREKVMKIMLFLFAFALGMYVSNKLPNWFSRNV
ncbi:hypothetical protein ACS0TY_007909 [Phlomoides rotata]